MYFALFSYVDRKILEPLFSRRDDGNWRENKLCGGVEGEEELKPARST